MYTHTQKHSDWDFHNRYGEGKHKIYKYELVLANLQNIMLGL